MMLFARGSIAVEIDDDKQAWFYTMYLLCLTGLLGITITGDAFNAFVFLEISSLATYVLIAMGRDRRALIASYQYLVMGTIGATFYIIGVGLLYLVTGSLNFADIAERLAAANSAFPAPVMAALASCSSASASSSRSPAPRLVPNAYAYAPSFATAFLAATATKVRSTSSSASRFRSSASRSISTRCRSPRCSIRCRWRHVHRLDPRGLRAEPERMLAYSSIAQIGYITSASHSPIRRE